MTNPGNIGLWRKLWMAVREVLSVIGIVIVLQVGLVQAYHVPTGSMESTILAGDFILADKITNGPRTPDWIGIPWTDAGFSVPALKLPGLRDVRPGDIVVVRTPMDLHVPYIKRVVAVGGQTVQVRNKVLFINGELFPLPRFEQHTDPFTFPLNLSTPGIPSRLGNRDNWGPYTVPDGYLFLMGDNRDQSADSRFFGPVPEKNVIGTARVVTLSWDNGRNVLFTKRFRFNRFGLFL